MTFHHQVDVDATVKLMAAGYDAGMNFFDNAEVYAGGKSEEVMGAALKKLGWRRGSYLVATTLFWSLHDNAHKRNTLNAIMPTRIGSWLRVAARGSANVRRLIFWAAHRL